MNDDGSGQTRLTQTVDQDNSSDLVPDGTLNAPLHVVRPSGYACLDDAP